MKVARTVLRGGKFSNEPTSPQKDYLLNVDCINKFSFVY
jgi:hypothetical protein